MYGLPMFALFAGCIISLVCLIYFLTLLARVSAIDQSLKRLIQLHEARARFDGVPLPEKPRYGYSNR